MAAKEKGDVEEQTPLLDKSAPSTTTISGSPSGEIKKNKATELADAAKEKLQKGGAFVKNMAGNLSGQFKMPEPESVMEYQTRDLASWQTYTYYTGTMLQNKLQRWVMVKLMIMAVFVCLGCMAFGINPRHVHALQFDKLNKTLNFFVGIMLAFFMGSSVKRWVDTVGGCLSLFDAIRNLNMQFLALGVNPDRIAQVTRYGLLSCEFLVIELHMRNKLPEERAAEIEKMWGSRDGTDDSGLEPWEQAVVKDVFAEENRVSSQMWIWVASLLGRMAQDGDIPPMASPTYGRIMNLAQDAQEGIRQVRISMTVQMPFIYVHTLAMLVHMNNICAAVDFGAHLAINLCGMLWFKGYHFWHIDFVSMPAQDGTFPDCFERIIMQLITTLFPAFMYMAFLQIGLTLAQPFDESFGPGLSAIPTRRLIDQTRCDIQAAEAMNAAVKGWDPPSFKQSMAPKKP